MPNRLYTKHGLKLITHASEQTHVIEQTITDVINALIIRTELNIVR